MATRTWSGASDTNLNNSANYSGAGALLATDDLVFNTGSVAATASADLSVNSITTTSGYSGNWSNSGHNFTVALGASFAHTGTLNLGNNFTANGASSTFSIGSGVSSVTASSCTLTLNGTTGMTLQDNSGVTFKALVLGTNAKATNSGSQTTLYLSAASPLTFTNGGTLTTNVTMAFRLNATGNILTITAGSPVLNGSGLIFFDCIGVSSTMSIPAFTYSGTNTIYIRALATSGNSIISLTGNIIATSIIIAQANPCTLVFNTGNHNITTTKNFNLQNSSSTLTTYNFGSSIIGCGSFSAYSSTGTIHVFLNSSQWTLTATLSASSLWDNTGWTINAGTSTITFAGSGNSNVTSNGQTFNNIVINGASLAFTFNDTPSVATLTVTSTLTYSHTGQVLTASSDVNFNGTGNYDFGNGITMTGASATLQIGPNIQYPTSAACVLTMNGTTGMVFQDNFGVSLNSLILGANAKVTNSGAVNSYFRSSGTPLTFTNGGTLTLNTILSFETSGNVNAFTVLAGTPTINGSNILFLDNNGLNTTMTIPTLNYTGTNNVIIRGISNGAGTVTITLTGNITSPSLIFQQVGTNALIFNSNGYTINASTISIGNTSNTTSTFNFSNSTINCRSVSNYTFTGPATINMGSSNWILTATIAFSGAWVNYSGWTFNPGTSILTFIGTGDASITSAGKSFNTIIINSASLTFYFYDDVSLHTLTTTAMAYFSSNGHSITSSGDLIFGGSVYLDIGTGITMTSPNTTLTFSNTIEGVDGSQCNVIFSANNITLQDNLGVTLKSFTLANGLTTTFATGINVYQIKFTGPSTLLTLGTNCVFHQNTRLLFTATGGCTLFSFGTGVTWYSSYNVRVYNNSGSTVNIPTVPYIGDGNGRWILSSSVNTTCTTTFTGDCDFSATIFDICSEADGPLIHTINFNGHNFSFDNLKVGNSVDNLNNNVTVNYGSGTFSLRDFDITNNDDGIDFSGPCTQNFQTSTFIVGANGEYDFDWYFAPNHVINAQNFLIQAVAVDANNPFVFSSNGHAFNDITLDYGGRRFITDSNMTCHNLLVTNGIWSNNGYSLNATGNVIFSGLDTVNLGNGLTMSGNGATLLIDARVGTFTSLNPVTFTGTGSYLTVNNNSITLPSVVLSANGSFTVNGTGNPFTIAGNGTLVSIGNNATANWNQITYLNPADSSTIPIFLGTGAVLNGRSNLIISTTFLDRLILTPGQSHSFKADSTTTLVTYMPGDWAGTFLNPIIINSDTTGSQAAVIIPGGISYIGAHISDIAFSSSQDATATISSFKNVSNTGYIIHTDFDSTNLGSNFGIDFPSVNYFTPISYISYPNIVHYEQAPYINDYPYTSIIDSSTLIGLTNFDPYFDDIKKIGRIDVIYTNGREKKIVTHVDGTATASWSSNALNGSWKKIAVQCQDRDGATLNLNSDRLKSSQDLFLVSAPYPYVPPIFYVDGLNGNDASSGLSVSQAFKTLQKGADSALPGSTVYVLDTTTYISNRDTTYDSHTYPLHINNPGLPGYYINYKAYSGRPKIYNDFNWAGIKVDGSAAYIHIEGFEVIGNAPAVDYSYAITHKDDLNNYMTSHTGISVQRAFPGDGTHFPHHVIIKNNICHDNAGSGIGAEDSDYISIIGNISYNNANWSPYAESGITFGFSAQFDKNPGYHHYVMGNYCYNNHEYVPFFAVGYISDGNGIIVDSLNTPQNSHGSFIGRTLIANNICFNNSGRGLNVFASSNVDVINNTTYHNGAAGTGTSPDGVESHVDSETSVNVSTGCFFYNNILYARPDRTVVDFFAPDATFDYNIYNSDSPFRGYPHQFVPGPHDHSGVNFFVNASIDPATADFHTTGIGHNDGTTFLAVTTDFNGVPRPQGAFYDRGAYES